MMRLGLSGNKASAEIAARVGVVGWAPNAITAFRKGAKQAWNVVRRVHRGGE